MKCSVMIALFLFSFSSWSARNERQLLKCLGQEEKKFHLNKDTGPVYDLNQRLISEMIQIPKAELTTETFNEICANPGFSPSWKLLELSISQGKAIFQVNEPDRIRRQMNQGMIEDYIEATREILLNFITQIQAQAPSANCLKEEIPQLDAFFTDIKYLQEDVDMKAIFGKRDVRIFQKLKDYPQAFERCRARLKKKLKSASKEAAKKS